MTARTPSWPSAASSTATSPSTPASPSLSRWPCEIMAVLGRQAARDHQQGVRTMPTVRTNKKSGDLSPMATVEIYKLLLQYYKPIEGTEYWAWIPGWRTSRFIAFAAKAGGSIPESLTRTQVDRVRQRHCGLTQEKPQQLIDGGDAHRKQKDDGEAAQKIIDQLRHTLSQHATVIN